jgi:hypothetical protein
MRDLRKPARVPKDDELHLLLVAYRLGKAAKPDARADVIAQPRRKNPRRRR